MNQSVESIDSKFRYILIAAKRARQLQAGAKPMVHTGSRKPTRIAQEEIKAGTVQWELIPLATSTPAQEGAAEDGASGASMK